MKYISLIVLLSACSPWQWKAADDILEGEISIVEKVAQDASGVSPKPKVDLVKKKF